ncbi:MAG: hypothetical protein ACHQHN_16055 [Sphingobacteriales bacterium]
MFKSFYLYLGGAIVALLLFIYLVVRYHSQLSETDVILSAIPVLVLSYLSFKVYHENADDELM